MAFADRHPELVAYAAFRSAQERGELPGPGCSDANVASLDAAGRYHLYVQWVADTQLAEIGDSLYLDLPVGVHPLGFDPWWEPDLFVDGVEGGAPPDAFFATGQSWGFRPLHPRALRDQGYRYPVACLRHIMRRASVIRIDHVMGLHRLYWVPDGFDAVDGVYVRYRLDEMLAVIALEADRTGTAVVGEDLGTVPDEVRAGMERSRMLRSWVFEFEATADVPLPTRRSCRWPASAPTTCPGSPTFGMGTTSTTWRPGGPRVRSGPESSTRRDLAWRASVEVDLAPDGDAAGCTAGRPSSSWPRARPDWSWSTWRTCGSSASRSTGPGSDPGPELEGPVRLHRVGFARDEPEVLDLLATIGPGGAIPSGRRQGRETDEQRPGSRRPETSMMRRRRLPVW